MTRKGTIFLAVALGIGLMLVISAWALPNPKTLPASHEKAVRLPCQGSRHLDQNEIQYRYVKTTDYGHSWSGIQQAGDLSDFEGWNSPMYDFGSICDDQNNLHYVGVLNAFADAADNGIYHVYTTDGGTTWSRNLIMAEGTNTLRWANAAIDPSGNLYCVIWGTDASENTTFWASKSTDHGATWSAPMVIAAAPGNMDQSASYPHLAEKTSATYCFFLFQEAVTHFEQYAARFPTDMSAGATIVNLQDYSGTEYNYYIGACMPMAYDVANNALFGCFRSSDLLATTVYLSMDQGAIFGGATITGGQRYPSVAADPAGQMPWVFSNSAVPATGAYHKDWYAFDELGYNGGSWTGITFLDSVLYVNPRDLLYVHQGYFSGSNVISMCNVWGQFTPEGLWVNYSDDGGATWHGGWKLWDIFEDGMMGGYIEQCQLDGGTGGVAYITFCAQYGESDLDGPVITNQTLVTPATSLGPYVVSADFSDATGVDYEGGNIWVNWRNNAHGSDYATPDSVTYTDEATFSGTYYFTVPDTHADGAQVADGDTIWFYCDGYDVVGNYSAFAEQAVVAGHVWLDVKHYPHPAQPTVYTLFGNFPNPFNPTTTIKFDVALPAQVELKVFNTLGQEVATLLHERLNTGSYSIPFDASNLTSGIYIYRLSANGFSESRKMVVLK